MAKWNFFVSNTSLIKELDTSGNDVNPQSQSFLAPTLDLQGSKIVFKDNGSYKTAIMFPEIGEIDGVNPSDLQDAYDRIIAIIPNSGGGGGGTLQQVTDNGNTTTNAINTGNIVATDVNSGEPTFTGKYSGADGRVLASFIDLDTNFQTDIVTEELTANRNYTLPDTSGTIAVTSDIPTELSELNDDSTHRLVTDTQISTWDGKQNTLTETNFGSFINGLTAKNTLVDADEVVSDDSADSNKAKRTSWLNVWLNYLKPKADALISSATSNTVNKLIIATPSANINSTSLTIVYSQLIPANTLPSSCVLDIDYRLVKTGVAGSWPSSIYINTSNSLSGATVISAIGPSSSALIIRLQRTFNIHSGTLKGVSFTTINIGYTDATTSTVAESSTSINVANDIYILIAVSPGSAVDTINGRHLRISW